MRWFVGDVHGCCRELDALLATVRFDPREDELWTVGDLVNRGPDSAAALRLWRDAGGRGVVGNHDVYALRAWEGAIPREADDTLADLFAAPDAPELLERLAPGARAPAGTARGRNLPRARGASSAVDRS
jgi:bis(5'-nucleosyl)-tetraphosphatase (symmetrical)